MKRYEVKQISTILSHFYNLEKLKKTLVFVVSKTIFFLIIAVEPLRSCFFEKCAVFTASMAAGMCNWFLKQNRPLWERAFLGALCTCNGLVCFLQSHLCSFFSFYKDKKNKKNNKKRNKNNKLRLTPSPWGVQSCYFCCFFVFLVSWCFVFLVRCYFEGLAKKVAGSNSLPLFPP